MRRAIKSLFGTLGYELRKKPSHELIDFLTSRSVDVVFDVGANTGQFGAHLRRAGYTGRIVSFEPIASAFAELVKRRGRDAAWHVENVALGDEAGKRTINVSELTMLSSLLPQRPAVRTTVGSRVEREEVITIATLDDVVGDLINKRCFLKIDTQGFERPVLEGGKQSVPLMTGIQLELPFIHFYEGVWSLSEAVEYMDGQGFVPSLMFPVVYHPRDPQALVEIDCVFRRKSDGID